MTVPNAENDKDYHRRAYRASLPWTAADYERVRQAARALVRTHTSVDMGRTARPVPTFDGDAYWDLLGALDRTEQDRAAGTR